MLGLPTANLYAFMRFVLLPTQRPRHPLVRILLTVLGLAVLGVFAVFGLMALSILLAVGGVALLVRQWKLARQPARRRHGESGARPAEGDVLEGEFVVVHHERAPRH